MLSLSAVSANAGITIPAGDWTVDINGNVNAFYINNHSKDNNTIGGGIANTKDASGNNSTSSINTGLLPSWLGISAKTRQNDLDVAWTISFQPGASQKASLGGGGGSEFRQAYITFGDASWGSIKLGKDLGLFGSNAILNDMTLLGVGSQGLVGQRGGTTTTLGRIGAGFLYADFNGQLNYTSPNYNGFQLTAGIAQPLASNNLGGTVLVTPAVGSNPAVYKDISASTVGGSQAPAFEGQVSYSWAGDFGGKVWLEGKQQRAEYSTYGRKTGTAWGIGSDVKAGGFDLVGYYYNAKGVGTTAWFLDGVAANGNRRDSDGYYLQAKYALPTNTTLGISYGESRLDRASGEAKTTLVKENRMTTVGAYHALTKSLNLVGEFSHVRSENQNNQKNDSNILSAGAILFF